MTVTELLYIKQALLARLKVMKFWHAASLQLLKNITDVL